MKKFKVLFAMCAMMLVLCGCSLKTEYGMSIKNDKSMDFSVIVAMDEELIDGMLSMENTTGEQVEYTDEQRWNLVDESTGEDEEEITSQGFSKEKYQEGLYYGYKYTKKISNIDDISGKTADFNLQDFQNISDSIVFVKDGDKYKANFIMSNEEQSEETEGYEIGIEMIFTVTLPTKPISHNATEVSEDGKTLTWNLLDKDSQNISFEFEFEKAASAANESEEDSNLVLYIGIGVGAIILIAIISIVVILKSKKKNDVALATQQPQTVPVMPSVEPQVQPVNPVPSTPVNEVPVQPSEPNVSENISTPEENNTNNQ